MIKYLLDELYTYEEDHCDALHPFDSLDPSSTVRKDGELGKLEGNPMCSLELRSRLEDLQLQNEIHQRQIEERYNHLLHNVNELSLRLSYPPSQTNMARLSHHPTQLETCSQGLSCQLSAEPYARYHPYSQVLTGPGIVFFFSRLIFKKSADLVLYSIQQLVNMSLITHSLSRVICGKGKANVNTLRKRPRK